MKMPTNQKSLCNITRNIVRTCCILFPFSFLLELSQNKKIEEKKIERKTTKKQAQSPFKKSATTNEVKVFLGSVTFQAFL